MVKLAFFGVLSAVAAYFVSVSFMRSADSNARLASANSKESAVALRVKSPEPSAPTSSSPGRSYGDVRDRLPCLPDDATMSPEALAKTPFRDRERLKQFVAAHPAETMATFKSVSRLVGDATRKARACLARIGYNTPLSVQISWTMHSDATEILLSGGRMTDQVAMASLADAVTGCFDSLTREPLRVRAENGASFVNYDGPYRAKIAATPAAGAAGPRPARL